MTARVSALSAQIAVLGMLGAILGVATIVALGGVIFGPSTSTWSSQLHTLGTSVLTITPGDAGTPAAANRSRSLTTADVDAISRQVPDITALSRAVIGTAPVAAGALSRSEVGQILVEGVDPSFARVTSGTLAQGTFFTTQDATSANRVAVLGQTLSSHLFQNDQSAIGATIRIRNVPFTVIGVLASPTSAVAENPDEVVLIPLQTGQVRLFGATAIDAVLVQVADASQTGAVSQQMEQVLRQRHQVQAGQSDGFTIRANSGPSAAAGLGGTASLVLGQVLDLARQYSCEAKGLCARAHA